ncbi:hypothetical protein CTAYLR_006609 [Chrysophaeum taylorii]|uniref:Uncharacterized protein n=1 Tax=Chrysophaeum taylorii TaxID=2483200 RepID=A0AAD7XQJ9_9STRA|nr:hypothetical protein CTAYLR_006609 [Chrysophaeum taylorii]
METSAQQAAPRGAFSERGSNHSAPSRSVGDGEDSDEPPPRLELARATVAARRLAQSLRASVAAVSATTACLGGKRIEDLEPPQGATIPALLDEASSLADKLRDAAVSAAASATRDKTALEHASVRTREAQAADAARLEVAQAACRELREGEAHARDEVDRLRRQISAHSDIAQAATLAETRALAASRDAAMERARADRRRDDALDRADAADAACLAALLDARTCGNRYDRLLADYDALRRPSDDWHGPRERSATISLLVDALTALKTANADRALWRLAANLRRHYLALFQRAFRLLRRRITRPATPRRAPYGASNAVVPRTGGPFF